MEADAVADQVADTMHGEEATAAPQPKITANLDGVGRKIHLAEDENAKNPADASIKRLGNDGQDGAALKDSLKQIQHERAACLEELSILEQSVEKLGLGEQRTEEVKRSIGRGKNALEEHLTDADITGAMRDVAGDPVRQPGSGRIFDHQQEVNDSLRALQSTRRELLRVRTELERRQFDPTTIAEVLQAPIESLQRVIETVRQALRKVQP
jgi:vacuolar-type H+-ATPase subunit I/STV1